MTKYSRALLLLMPLGLALAWAQPAQAGMLGWMDDAFTFRTEQKPLITPKRGSAPPKVVVQPYYPNDEHVAWSNFYTRTDLEPQDYLSNSASKVMRPIPTAQQRAATTPAQADGGWPAIAERAAANAQAESDAASGPGGNVMIGDPGEGWGMKSGDSQVGRETRIGAAVKDWNEDGSAKIASRPGDYDYHAPVGTRADIAQVDSDGGVAVSDPNPTARSSGVTTFTRDTGSSDTGNDSRYVKQNAKGQVTAYKVQSGDTLSSISGQPAIYGTWKLWPLIYSANRRAIGNTPTNIKRDERLDIPRDYTDEQAAAAERKAGGR